MPTKSMPRTSTSAEHKRTDIYNRPVGRGNVKTGGAQPVRTAETGSSSRMVKKAERTRSQNQMHLGRMVFFGALVFIMFCTILYRYAILRETESQYKELTSQYENLVLDNQMLQSKIDASVELSALEKIAKDELGMVKPDDSQVFYINMNLGDSGEKASGRKSDEKSMFVGTPGALIHAIEVLK